MTGKLINPATGETFALEEISSMGRSRDSVVVIPDPRVSRRHALIRKQDDGFWFFDLGSANGSYVNERRVTTSQLLRNGDRVRIGNHRFSFETAGSADPTADEPETDVTLVDVHFRDAILLVCDIQGFTTLSERLDPDQLAPIIGSWYARTEHILESNGAALDKFIGDCALAYWLDTSPSTRRAALDCALSMQAACQEVQNEHRDALAAVDLEFRSGVAVHIGPTAYGSFSPQQFTLLGDAVNLVFRIEGLTRSLGEGIVVSEEVLKGWDEGRALCRPLGPQRLRGREQEVELFALDNESE